MKAKTAFKIIKNNRGALSADFIFSFIIGIMMCLFLFVMASTFTLVEVGQYIAFSSARAMSAGNINSGNSNDGPSGNTSPIQTQSAMAHAKFRTLSTHPFIAKLINNPWFKIEKDNDFLKLGLGVDQSDVFGNYSDNSRNDRVTQTGVKLRFTPTILQTFKISFLAPPAENIQSNLGFAGIAGLLIREPTSNECYAFMKERYPAILTVDQKRFEQEFQKDDPLKTTTINISTYSGEDNGC